ncbi:MAG TPA: YdeI/OmpD-associated family protein [Chitinophagaceae bacterium]
MKPFSAKIQIIGVNPYVLLPSTLLKYIFQKAGKDKGAIPVQLKIDGKNYIQNLVKYSGKWRLYLNTPMRKAAGKDVGDTIVIKIDFDSKLRITPMHPKLKLAFKENPTVKKAFEKLSPSRRKEILRYINFLKSEESVNKNILRAIAHLTNSKPFIGREK